MVDNQHRKIKGYRDLSQNEIDLMNRIKEAGLQLEALHNSLVLMQANSGGEIEPDMRWVSVGKTHLQQGLMAWTRAVAKPEFF